MLVTTSASGVPVGGKEYKAHSASNAAMINLM
jgi:hypothetical protein